MKGDYTRETFRPARHYSGVLQQQGRVSLDADWNEQVEIERHQRRMLARDLIGPCGGPKGETGFEISVDGSGRQLHVGAGRYYVDGLLVENEAECAFELQPDLPAAAGMLAKSAEVGGSHLVYLDVWERLITALDDPTLLEPALGGPDTTVRIKTVWQVRLVPLADARQLRCGKRGSGASDEARPAMDVRTGDGGYTGAENRLYRVEVHSVDETGRARFKWSRDNASLAVAVEKMSGTALTVADGVPGSLERLAAGEWLELTDDALELDGEVGRLAQVAKVDLRKRSITLTEPQTPLAETADGVDPLLHPKARRWHGVGEAAPSDASDDWTPLEDGIDVSFGGGGGFVPGDYWQIPARPQGAGVEWPGGPQPAKRLERWCCPLAVVEMGTRRKRWRVLEDKRRIFAPLRQGR